MSESNHPDGKPPPADGAAPPASDKAFTPDGMIWPRFVAMQDFGDGLKFTLLDADGSTREAMVWKRFKRNQPELYDPALVSRIGNRNTDWSSPRSLIFELDGGIGDIIIATQAIAALRRFLDSSSNVGLEYIGLMSSQLAEITGRFFAAVPVLDKIVIREPTVTVSTRFQPLLLDATPFIFRAGDLTVGNVWDHLWWKWGVPGRFPGQGGFNIDRLRGGAPGEIADLRQHRPGFPQPGQYLLLADDATMLRGKKAWPDSHWAGLVDWILGSTGLNLVVMMDANRARSLPGSPRVFVYDFRQLGSQGVTVDLLRLCSIVEGARTIVSVDSGVAHVAGLLNKPCITIWGPTRAITHGQPTNINLRLSSCPPCCSDAFREAVCSRAICMEEIPAKVVIDVLGKLLTRPDETRRMFGCG